MSKAPDAPSQAPRRTRAHLRGRQPSAAGAARFPVALLALLPACIADNHAAVASAAVGLAALSSDYKVTTVSLYNPESGQVTDGCIRSDLTGPVLAQPLSGDVTLPSQAQGGELIVIDRKNSVLTFVEPTSCTPRAQLSVSTGGFVANPRDVIRVSAHKAYVTRYETNPNPTDDPSDFDEGEDLLVIDPLAIGSSSAQILKRIALSPYASSVAGTTILARPDHGVLANGKVYVTLGDLNVDFTATGTGRVVVVDPETDAVTGVIELPGQKGCSAIAHVASTNRLYVSCGGAFTDADQAAGSALVEIDLSAATPTVGRVVAARQVGNLPINFTYAAVLGETAFVGTLGVLDVKTGDVVTPDAFYAVALASGAATKLVEGGAYNFGRASVDANGKKVYLPDGDAMHPLVRIFDAAGANVVPGGGFDADPTGHLPSREIAWY